MRSRVMASKSPLAARISPRGRWRPAPPRSRAAPVRRRFPGRCWDRLRWRGSWASGLGTTPPAAPLKQASRVQRSEPGRFDVRGETGSARDRDVHVGQGGQPGGARGPRPGPPAGARRSCHARWRSCRPRPGRSAAPSARRPRAGGRSTARARFWAGVTRASNGRPSRATVRRAVSWSVLRRVGARRESAVALGFPRRAFWLTVTGRPCDRRGGAACSACSGAA